MLFADAGAEFGVVQQQVSELCPLLDKVELGHSGCFALEFFGWYTYDFAEDVARVVVGQRLVKVRGEQVVL